MNMHGELEQLRYMTKQRYSNIFFTAIDIEHDTYAKTEAKYLKGDPELKEQFMNELNAHTKTL